MPGAIQYIPPTDSERNAFNDVLLTEKTRRRTAYRQAIEYYTGSHDAQLTGDEAEYNTTYNLVKMTAERTASFLFPELPRIDLDPDSIEPTQDEQWINRVLEENGGLAFLHKVAIRGFLAGHTFLRVKPNKRSKYPSIISLDPTSVTVYWRADDINDVYWYELRYYAQNRVIIQDFVCQDDGTWIVYTYSSSLESSKNIVGHPTNLGRGDVQLDFIDFERSTFELTGTLRHSSKIAPIVETSHLPHPDSYYGQSEFTEKDLQDLINKIASERNRIVRQNSDPVDFLIGADVEDIEDGDIMSIANPSAKISRLEMKSDLTSITGVLDKLVETYLSVLRVVLLKGEVKDLQRVTNASIRTLFLDALAKNTVLRDLYGRMLREMITLVLEIGYSTKQVTTNPEDRYIKINFGSPLPQDMTEIANNVQMGINNGYVSKRTAAIETGRDWKFEKAAIQAEAQEAFTEAQKYMLPTLEEDESDSPEVDTQEDSE